MSLIQINSKLYITFNEEFTNTKELIKDIPDFCELIFDIEILRIRIYGDKHYKDVNLLLTEFINYESKLYKSIYRLNYKKSIDINGNKYRIKNLIHTKIFSLHKPHIPIIEVNKTIVYNGVIMYKDKILGISNDSTTIMPLYFLINICYNFIKNSGFFFFVNELDYDIYEVLDDKIKIDYYLVLKKKFKIKNINSFTYIFNPGDIIYSINNVQFNFNGHLYSEKYRMYFTLNTYILLHDIIELQIHYTPNKNNIFNNEIKKDYIFNNEIKKDYNQIEDDIIENQIEDDIIENKFKTLKVKTIQIKLDKFDETKLKIPNIDDAFIRYNLLTFNLLTEKLYKSVQNKINIPIQNKYSSEKIIVTELDSILYRVVKISNKNINSLDDVNLMLYKKNILMSKRTIILKNLENGDLKKIIL
jgi:hypothetical protein